VVERDREHVVGLVGLGGKPRELGGKDRSGSTAVPAVDRNRLLTKSSRSCMPVWSRWDSDSDQSSVVEVTI
jgi:hypothetical protein